jgi:hypothetical protein
VGSIGPNVAIEDLIPGAKGQKISGSFLPQLVNKFGQEKKVVLLLSHEKIADWGSDIGSSIVMDSIHRAGLREEQKLDFNGVKVQVFSRE